MLFKRNAVFTKHNLNKSVALWPAVSFRWQFLFNLELQMWAVLDIFWPTESFIRGQFLFNKGRLFFSSSSSSWYLHFTVLILAWVVFFVCFCFDILRFFFVCFRVQYPWFKYNVFFWPSSAHGYSCKTISFCWNIKGTIEGHCSSLLKLFFFLTLLSSCFFWSLRIPYKTNRKKLKHGLSKTNRASAFYLKPCPRKFS